MRGWKTPRFDAPFRNRHWGRIPSRLAPPKSCPSMSSAGAKANCFRDMVAAAAAGPAGLSCPTRRGRSSAGGGDSLGPDGATILDQQRAQRAERPPGQLLEFVRAPGLRVHPPYAGERLQPQVVPGDDAAILQEPRQAGAAVAGVQLDPLPDRHAVLPARPGPLAWQHEAVDRAAHRAEPHLFSPTSRG